MGLEDQQPNLNDLVLYPNPTSEFFSVKNAPENLHVLMYDMNGKQCLTSTHAANPIDISKLASGKYNVILKIDNAFIVKELIVQ